MKIIQLRDPYDPIITTTYNSVWYSARMAMTCLSNIKINLEFPRRWGKTHLFAQLLNEFYSTSYFANNRKMCVDMRENYNISTRQCFSLEGNGDDSWVIGQQFSYMLFDEVSKYKIDNILSYVKPKGYISLRSC